MLLQAVAYSHPAPLLANQAVEHGELPQLQYSNGKLGREQVFHDQHLPRVAAYAAVPHM
jgi:hypothetical protein